MKKLTVSSIRKPLNLLLSYEISMSRFVEMINEEIGFDEILNEEEGFERDVIIENKEINENIIYVDNTALNISLLDKFGYSNNFNYYYCYVDSYYEGFIKINLDKKEYNVQAYAEIKNTITTEALFDIINK